MHFPRLLFLLVCLWATTNLPAATYNPPTTNRLTLNFNADWNYFKGEASGAQAVSFNDASWAPVGLPHTTKLVTPDDTLAYLGVSWYRKHFTVANTYQGRKVFIEFGAAMQVADVWVNGTQVITQHAGGYMPFTADVTALVNYTGGDNVIAVRVDSSPNSNFAPGKNGIDFQYHGGLYRNVTLSVTDPLHVTDAVYANKVASGGVFVTYPSVSTTSATVSAKTHVRNEASTAKSATVVSTLVDKDGNTVQSASTTVSLAAGADTSVSQNLVVASPNLWHPYTPYLYTLYTVIQDGSTAVDSVKTRVGIRRIQWSNAGGFSINGSRFKARGADYHQDIYLLGNAMPAQAIYNDVKRIKDAGMDFIRGSHYPHDPAFYDACDELGVLVMNSISGWQYYNDSTTFKNNTYQECRDMIRRDRNHPSVVVWETSLNESDYNTNWAQTIHALAHTEFPGDQMYTAGWTTSVFDIYCASSQSRVRDSNDPRPIIINEYGSWDYGEINSTSDVAREDSEADLLQQCTNLTESLNKNLAETWFSADAYWVFGDYCGYLNNVLNRCGVVDFHRLPKFSYYFYKSQRDANISIPNVDTGPMVYIANLWQPGSTATVRVFSNCSQVSLYLNNTLIATKTPDTNYPYLPHPPFTFNVGSYTSGILRAEGRIGGTTVATNTRRTAGAPSQIVLRPEGTTSINADGGDARLVFIDLVDANGQVVPAASNTISLSISGPGKIIGPTTVALRAGQLATWVQAGRAIGQITLTASGNGVASASSTFNTVAVPGLAPLSLPTAPSNLTGTANGSQASLAWSDNSANEAGFVIERSTDNVNFTQTAAVGPNITTATITEGDGTGTYYYRVTAQNGAGVSTPSNVVQINLIVAATANVWTYSDIGNVGASGSASVSSTSGSAALTINAAGSDIYGTTDSFGFHYIQRAGDFEIVARVASLTNTDMFAKAGVMIRSTLSPGSPQVLSAITPAGGSQMIFRTTNNGPSNYAAGNQTLPGWVRLVRSGNTFTASTSGDGNTWTAIGSEVIPMPNTVYTGLAVTSHSAGNRASGAFDSIRFKQGDWTDSDIGAVNILGNGVIIGDSGATQASGSDIWVSADAFHYVYQAMAGNFAITSQITNLTNTHNAAKAGVMIRNTLSPASAFGLVNLTPGGSAEFIRRTASADGASSSSIVNQSIPKWVRLVRVGDSFRGYVSPDGSAWSQIGAPISIPMNSVVYLGLAATSHNNSAVSAANYENISIELPGVLGFANASASVSETDGSAIISVNRTAGSVGPVSITYATTSGGTAVAGTNYSSVFGTLNWADGDAAPKTFSIPILNDNISGANRTIRLGLKSTTGGAVIGTSTSVLTIVENATQNWRFAKFGGNANNPAIAGDNADPDGDGITNVVEYALSTDPNSTASMPELVPDLISGGYQLALRRNATADDVALLVRQSSDLTNWTTALTYTAAQGWVANAPGATTVETAVSGTGVDRSVGVTIQIPDVSAGANLKQFFRLSVSRL